MLTGNESFAFESGEHLFHPPPIRCADSGGRFQVRLPAQECLSHTCATLCLDPSHRQLEGTLRNPQQPNSHKPLSHHQNLCLEPEPGTFVAFTLQDLNRGSSEVAQGAAPGPFFSSEFLSLQTKYVSFKHKTTGEANTAVAAH